VTQLAPNFTLEELVASATAAQLGIDNTPSPAALAELLRLATAILQPIRDLVGVPVHVHVAYRSPELNAALVPPGVPNSQHCLGQAADIDAEGWSLDVLFNAIRASAIPFDQLILEQIGTGGCVHVSCAADGAAPRGQALIRSSTPPWTYQPAA
jgi:zinc D-Ala-D-Ala carboxypeptidase